jgi:hypothetical protein
MRRVVDAFELDEHHVKLLVKCCEAHDRGEQAREILAVEGLTFADRFGQPRARPELAIERDSRTGFPRMLREIGLDITPPADSRPPSLKANGAR